MRALLRRLTDTLPFQGSLQRRRYFEGWYFKQVSADRRSVLAIIPGISLAPSGSTAFVQAIDGQTGAVRWFPYPIDAFSFTRDPFSVEIGENRFALEGIDVSLRDAEGAIEGHLRYSGITPLSTSGASPGIMGRYRYAPFMECYHGIGSLDHRVDGWIRWDRAAVDFSGGRGYLEKDWGRSMPQAWLWAQSNSFAEQGACFLFSLARIPWLGSSFSGFFALLAAGGTVHRLATYTGARVASAELHGKELDVQISDRRRHLRVCAQRSHEGFLRAPVDGVMDRRIGESINARLRVRLEEDGAVRFEGTGECAGLEVVGDPRLIGVRTG